MQRIPIAVLLSIVLWMSGCAPESTPVPGAAPANTAVQPPAAPQPSPAAPAKTEAAPAKTESAPAQPEAATAQPAAPETPPSAGANQTSIQLSAGVALPQTGPDGTLMSFSVDYEFAQGEPSTDGDFWVIERAHGKPLRQQNRLTKHGNLMVLVPGWRPEDGPFHSHIEDRAGNRISESIEMHVTGE